MASASSSPSRVRSPGPTSRCSALTSRSDRRHAAEQAPDHRLRDGADRLIGGAPQPGGITFEEIEDLEITSAWATTSSRSTRPHREDDAQHEARQRQGLRQDALRAHVREPRCRHRLDHGHERRAEARPAARAADRHRRPAAGQHGHAGQGLAAEGADGRKVDEIQQLTIDATGGTFTLALGGCATSRCLRRHCCRRPDCPRRALERRRR